MVPSDQDDTDRCRDLEKSEGMFRRLFEDFPIGMVILDRDLIITRANRAFATMLGYEEAEVIGRPVVELTDPSDRPVAEAFIREACASTELVVQVEKRYRHKSGGSIIARASALAIHDEEGHPLYALGIVEDLTEQKRAEESLQVAREAEIASRVDQARLEGVLLAAHLTADRLGNALSLTRGYNELVLEQFELPARGREMLGEALLGLQLAIDHLHELQNIVRVATRETPLGPMLDVPKSTRRDPDRGPSR